MKLRVVSCVVLFVAVLWASASPSAAAGRRIALVIGNSRYAAAGVLPNPVRDAAAIGDMFRKAGFNSVVVKTNLTADEMRRALSDFQIAAEGSDIAVVYFSGHGLELNGENYLVPVDATLRRDVYVEDETISLKRVLRAVDGARRLKLVILDACRDNPFLSRMQIASRAVPTRGLAPMTPKSVNVLIAYAAAAGSVASDGSGDHSPYTAALLRHLTEPNVDVRVAFGEVTDDVRQATDGLQEPFTYSSFGGSTLSLAPKASTLPETAQSPEAVAWAFASSLGSAAALRQFLKDFPSSIHRSEAQAKLASLPSQHESSSQRAPITKAAPGPSAEDIAWEFAQSSHTAEAFRRFLKDFPKSRHRLAAERLIARLAPARRTAIPHPETKRRIAKPKLAKFGRRRPEPGAMVRPRPTPAASARSGAACFNFNGQRYCE